MKLQDTDDNNVDNGKFMHDLTIYKIFFNENIGMYICSAL